MELLAHLVPAKEHDRNESSLHKEGQNAFDSKRRPEDIAHKPAVIAPVGSELKLQNQSRRHAYGKVDTE